jgi:transcriptional regulator with XRE-family HTH domain
VVIQSLSDVRRRYDDVMARAAAAPGSTLGQQLYAARIEARLSAEEVANGAGLRADLINDLEAGEIPTEEEAAKVRELIAALGGVPGTEHLRHHEGEHDNPQPEHHDGEHHEGEHHDQPDAYVNGWDESFVGGG